jgi:putative ABC transporter-associated repeat protein
VIRRLIGAVVAVSVLSTPGAALAQPGDDRQVIADGHVDMGPRFVDGKWTVQIKDDRTSPPSWRDLSDVVLQVPDAAKAQVPADPAYSFLGAAGNSVWLLPQVQRPGVLWPGWNTQDPQVASTVSREVTWKLHGVRGPGSFVLFLTGNFGAPQAIFDSTKAFPQETGVEINSHVHGNWTFSAAGTYLLDVEMSASANDGKALADRRTLRIHVGDNRPEAAFDVGTTTTTVPPTTVPPSTTARDDTVVTTTQQSSTPPWWLIGVAIAILLSGVAWIALRRRGRTGD